MFAEHNPADFDLPADGSYAQVIYSGDGIHGDPTIHLQGSGRDHGERQLNLLQRYRGTSAVTCELGLVRSDGFRISFGQAVEQEVSFGVRDDSRPVGQESISLSGGLTRSTPGDYLVNVVCRSEDWYPGAGFDRATFDSGSLIAWAT